MERRSWLWGRKSSEKSPESSGSISSHSESFSDDQVYVAHNSQSPEVTSKAVPETDDSVESLKEKLSSALVSLNAKEEAVKQHAKVAEEAVAGWERAEDEVLALKQQLEAATNKCSSLQDRVGHLDGALKECVRQLRQAREEQEQKIREAMDNKTLEWESTKLELGSQIMQLQAKLEEPDLRLCSKLEAIEKANSSMKRELLSRAEEVKVRTIERDLSTEAAEAASKQHLEDMRKLAKLEAECKRLKAIARESSAASDSKSSVHVGRNSDYRRNKSNSMDDFLEMERLAALADTESETSGQVEERRKKMEEEKAELEIVHKQLETSRGELKKAELKLRALQAQLAQTNESKASVEEQLEASNIKTEAVESQLRILNAEIENLHSRIASLEGELQKEHDLSTAKCEKLEDEVEKERASASESLAKCRKLEAEVLGMKQGLELQQEKELAVAASKFTECQKTIASLGRQLKSLASLEDFLIDEKSPDFKCPQKGMERGDVELVSSPEKSNGNQNGIGKRLPRGRSRFRKERLRE